MAGHHQVKLPNGREAAFESMQRYGAVLQNLIRDQEENLAQVTNAHRHNQILDYLQNNEGVPVITIVLHNVRDTLRSGGFVIRATTTRVTTLPPMHLKSETV